jgi:uncharacterized membrane protein (UPF0136 family)
LAASSKSAVVALALCAVADFAAVPAVLSESDSGAPVALVAGAAVLLGLLTLWAAAGIARGQSWAVPLALTTRALDVVAALPGLGAGPGPAVAVVTVVLLSAVAVFFLVRVRRTALVG